MEIKIGNGATYGKRETGYASTAVKFGGRKGRDGEVGRRVQGEDKSQKVAILVEVHRRAVGEEEARAREMARRRADTERLEMVEA